MIIGIAGVARSGKDTFYKYAKYLISKHNILSVRHAFADQLKADLDEVILKRFGIDVWNPTEEQKKVIRPILVSYGCGARLVDPDIWLNLVLGNIEKSLYDTYHFITDVRFPNEVEGIKNKGGYIVHVSRVDNGELVQPANDEEKKNDPIVKSMADHCFSWETSEDEGYLKISVAQALGVLEVNCGIKTD